MTLPGADSVVAQPGFYGGKIVWGIYVAGATPHIWTHAEVAQLRAHGVRGCMPITVPPQNEEWWTSAFGAKELALLVAQARAWGLKVGSPLCLDIEEHQAEAVTATTAQQIERRWAVACGTYGYRPWTYGGRVWHNKVGDPSSALKWLAEWPTKPGVAPKLPPGYHAWQYAGNVYGGRIDLDLFESGRTYYGTDGEPVNL